jgi:outer membrane protein TolC
MANSRYRYNVTSIKKEFRNLAARAVELLYNIKLTKLRIEKLRLQLKNSDIEINKMQDLFNAGLTDSVEVDKSLAKRDEIEIDILSLQSNLENLRGEFKKLSYKNPDTLKPPKLRMIPKSKFLKRNLELELARTNILMAKYNAKIVKSKYLPTVTVGLRLTKTRPVEWGYRENAFSFNFKVSMPLSINKKDDLELAKLDKIISQLDLKTKLRTIKKDYYITAKKLKVLSRQISLANKEAKIYKRLLINTTKLFKAGQKSKSDVEVLKNSYKIKKLDSKIYEIEKQLELINLYAQIR